MTSTAAAPEAFGRAMRGQAGETQVLQNAASLAEAEPIWRAFEANALLSPYSRFDWVQAYAAATPGSEIQVAIGRDADGDVDLILPFAIAGRLGLRIGETVGGKHANYTMPLIRPDSALQPERLRGLLDDVGRQLRLDAFAFTNVPLDWRGQANPLAAGGQASPSPAHSLELERTADATFARSMSADARKKLRNKARGLAKAGRIEVIEARDPDSVTRILDAFFRQKSERFRDLGVADPFAAPEVRDFIGRASTGEEPAIELYALSLDGEPIATLGGAATRDRLSGMFLSFSHSPVTARFSPGDILVHHVIERQCERGRRSFDLGVGDARYKRSVCDGLDELVDVMVPVTARGRLYGAALGVMGDMKRRLKADPRAMAAISALRRRLARG